MGLVATFHVQTIFSIQMISIFLIIPYFIVVSLAWQFGAIISICRSFIVSTCSTTVSNSWCCRRYRVRVLLDGCVTLLWDTETYFKLRSQIISAIRPLSVHCASHELKDIIESTGAFAFENRSGTSRKHVMAWHHNAMTCFREVFTTMH